MAQAWVAPGKMIKDQMGVRLLPAPAETGVGARLRQERSHDPDEAPERAGIVALARVAVAGHLARGRCKDVDLSEAEPILAGAGPSREPANAHRSRQRRASARGTSAAA